MILMVEYAPTQSGPWKQDTHYHVDTFDEATTYLEVDLFNTATEEYTKECLSLWNACEDLWKGIIMPNGDAWDRFRVVS